MKGIFVFCIIVSSGILSVQAQVSDSSKRTNSRRPTINQSQAKPNSKEMLEIELNKNRNKGAQVDTSGTKSGTNTGSAKNVRDSSQRSPNIPAFDAGTSSAGSPSQLSGDNGKQRDGTNTVQRSSYNMAGSPPPRKSARASSSVKAGKPDEKSKAENKSADTDKRKKKSKKKDKD
ncbi:MAG TPA: hypothetical protein VIN08_00325 [Ohtaekwangia sp.]|uniref:hypothetical protein n=1 Tax=Ohtaekwangia sp. TaxID=2066019 RepID=UPI002F94B74B